jgi:hypothetical protein
MKLKVISIALCLLTFASIANAANAAKMTRLSCEIWLKENASGYVYMVEGYLLGLYRYQSLVGNPSGSFSMVSSKELPGRVAEECNKNPQGNVGDIAIAIKQQLDQKYGTQ